MDILRKTDNVTRSHPREQRRLAHAVLAEESVAAAALELKVARAHQNLRAAEE